MDVWNIYSVGDAHFLSQVLNAVAAICSTSDFTSACGVALLLGAIILCVQAVLRMQLPVQTIAICYVFWFVCYYPTVSVNIHDVYTQEDRRVDNVPLGPAAIGSIVSTFGFKITEIMETAFQMPEASETLTGSGGGSGGRYGNALYYLNNAIRLGNDPVVGKAIDEANSDEIGDYARSLNDYVRYCTFRAVQLGPRWGGKTVQQILDQPSRSALQFDSDTYFTQIWQNGESEDLTCRDAWPILFDKQTRTFAGGSSNDALTQLGIKLGAVANKDPDLTWNNAKAVDITTETQRAFQALRMDAVDAQNFMFTSFAYDIFRAGMARGYNDYMDRMSAIAINQAIAQRNMQWASEQTMFFDTMRPMMSFVEGFVYAITPFAAFIMLLGVFGLRLYFKYFLLLIWIQLWLPVTAICNMYILYGATRELSEFAEGGLNPTSFYALNHISQAVSTWIATGGMFAAATPLLSFIIVSGSAFAITSLTNRMAGSDHFNEKIASPDIVTPGAALQMSALYKGDSMKQVLSGAAELTPSLNIGEVAQSTATRAAQEAQTSARSFTDTFARAMQEQGSSISQSAQSAMLSEVVNASRSQEFGAAIQEVKDSCAAKNIQLTDDEARTLAIGLGMQLPVLGSLAQGQARTASGQSLGEVYNDMKKNQFSFSNAAKSQIGLALSSGLTKTNTDMQSYGFSETKARTLQTQAVDVMTKSQTKTEASQLAQSIGVTQSVDLNSAASAMSDRTRNWFHEQYSKFKRSLPQAEQDVLTSGEKKFISQNGLDYSSPTAGMLNALLEYRNAEGHDETLQARTLALKALKDVPMMSGADDRLSNITQNTQSDVNGSIYQIPGSADGAAGDSGQAQSAAQEAPTLTAGASYTADPQTHYGNMQQSVPVKAHPAEASHTAASAQPMTQSVAQPAAQQPESKASVATLVNLAAMQNNISSSLPNLVRNDAYLSANTGSHAGYKAPAERSESDTSRQPRADSSSAQTYVPDVDISKPNSLALDMTPPQYPSGKDMFSGSPEAFAQRHEQFMRTAEQGAVADTSQVNAQNNELVAARGKDNHAALNESQQVFKQIAIDNLNKIRAIKGEDEGYGMKDVKEDAIDIITKSSLFDRTGSDDVSQVLLGNQPIVENMGLNGVDYEGTIKDLYNNISNLHENSGAVEALSDAVSRALSDSGETATRDYDYKKTAYENLMESKNFNQLTDAMGLKTNEEKETYAKEVVNLVSNAAAGLSSDMKTMLYVTHNMGDALR